MKFDKLCNAILERVFHGTAHDVVGNFSLNKIGTGEGNIAYGWGLYFAENPEIAKGYKKGLTHKDFLRKVSEVYDEYTSPEEEDSQQVNWHLLRHCSKKIGGVLIIHTKLSMQH